MSRILYISYDGMLEPLGQSQVLSYLSRLARDHQVHLLSFEKPEYWRDTAGREKMRERMRASGLAWHPMRYHKRPSALATAWDIAAGSIVACWLALRHRIGIVHARSYVPSVMALTVKATTGSRFVFDMRGFWADERVDGGIWKPNSRLYRVAKWFERRFLLNADEVVSLTHAGVREMHRFDYLRQRMPRFTVIPTCADLDRFKPGSAKPRDLVIGYVGSAGTWYLFREVARTFRELLRVRPDARLRVLNRSEHEYIRSMLSEEQIPDSHVEIEAAEHEDVPAKMAAMHAGIFFIKPVFSKQASAPTKLAEFLGCGIPCLANAGVGDLAGIVEGEGVGIALRSFDSGSIRDGVRELLALVSDPGITDRCVEAARRHFSLDHGVDQYNTIYRRLTETA